MRSGEEGAEGATTDNEADDADLTEDVSLSLHSLVDVKLNSLLCRRWKCRVRKRKRR